MRNTELTERVPAVFASLLYDYLAARDEPPKTVLGNLYMAVNTDDPRGIRVQQWGEMLERAADYLNQPALGLSIAETMRPYHLGTFGYLITACSTLADVLLRLERYQRLAYDVVSMSTRIEPDYVDIVWDTAIFDPGRMVNETGVAMVIQFCRTLTGLWGGPLLVKFPGPRPADIEPYTSWFGCDVQFDANEAVIRASLISMGLPLTTADAKMAEIMVQRADRLLATMPNAEPVITQVRQAIARLLHDGEPDLKAVAVNQKSSSRSLQRSLQKAGTSYRSELARVRRRLAETYLRDPGLSIADIAMLLGYSEHSAFTRGYKEWTGRTPVDRRAAYANGVANLD